MSKEYNKRKKEELKRFNEQITKQDDMVDHKPKSNMNNYVYASGLSVFGLAITQSMKEHKAEKRFIDLNSAMQQYFMMTSRQLEPLPPKPVLSNFYVPSEDHHNHELAFITLSMIGIGAFLWYSNK